ncbi:L-arabinose-binding protein [Halobacillus karajensis]|uniref:Arabinose-binding protein n=1 Tax=Halobacillus karajensis TaxID=195088 RepID=A0A024P906_9BACI|nr:ABC transporter substrate-binding protein [Halobacillus karajensis]CDQ20136.1 putative arabinose-binding protein precursor [Halobacillus karajensis]CDQ25201.1 putative arabinose-binding protein precursor [Halobacillus karajensis]CDQ28438.1 putative arabinose-binding protein precursor [Halobacillus karajensis]SEI01084.1 L-arabinose-binding protein [Halobacillus karajensis]
MKKGLLVLMFSLMSLVLLACGGGDEASGEAEETEVIGEDVEGATELTFWTFVGQHVDLFRDSAKRWNEENPDRPIKLVAETYPYDQMHNNLLLALQSGKGAPDIVDIEQSKYANYMQGEPQLEPLNEYVEPVLEDSVTSRFEMYAKDGKYYGAPTHVGATVMYYNKEIMDQAGVDIDSIKTWDDFVEAGKKVGENTDAVMWNVGTTDYLMDFFPMVSQRESDFFNEEGEVTLDNEKNVDTLQFLSDVLYKHNIAELTPGGMNQTEEFYGYMNEGNAAAVLAPLWYMGRFIDNMPDLEGKMAIRPLPAWEEGGDRTAGMGGTGTAVTNQAEEAELAKEFLAFTKLSEEGNVNLWKVLGFDPPRWDVWESDAVRQDNEYYDYFGEGIFDMLLEVKDEINEIQLTEYTPDVATEYNTNVAENVLRQQSQSPEEALKEAADKIRDMK